jgi:hypothetical protein
MLVVSNTIENKICRSYKIDIYGDHKSNVKDKRINSLKC